MADERCSADDEPPVAVAVIPMALPRPERPPQDEPPVSALRARLIAYGEVGEYESVAG